MPRQRQIALVHDVTELVECIKEVQQVLGHYSRTCSHLAKSVDEGKTLQEGFDSLEGPLGKREVTEALESLERVRHRVRVSLFSLAEEERMTASETGRQLGISRQLAARYAQEARSAKKRRS